MSYTENLIRSTDFAVFIKGCRGEWIPYPESGRIFSTVTITREYMLINGFEEDSTLDAVEAWADTIEALGGTAA